MSQDDPQVLPEHRLTAGELNSGDVASPFRLFVFSDQEKLVLHLIEGDLVIRTDGSTGAVVGDVLIGAEGTEFYVRRRKHPRRGKPYVTCAVFEGAVLMQGPAMGAIRIGSGKSWDWDKQKVAEGIPDETVQKCARILSQPMVDRIRSKVGESGSVEDEVRAARQAYAQVLRDPKNTKQRAELSTLQLNLGVVKRTSYDLWRLRKAAEESGREPARKIELDNRIKSLSTAYEAKVRSTRETRRIEESLALLSKLSQLGGGADISRRRALALDRLDRTDAASEAALEAVEQNARGPILDRRAVLQLWRIIGSNWSQTLKKMGRPVTKRKIESALAQTRRRAGTSPTTLNQFELALLTRVSGDGAQAQALARRVLTVRPTLSPKQRRVLKALAAR
jgi:hypothetical protein